MSMRDAMNQWMEKQQPESSEWVEVCKRLSDDENVRALCVNLANDYEAKKIDDMEFVASLSTTSGKTMDQIEEVLSQVTSKEKPQESQVMQQTLSGQVTDWHDKINDAYKWFKENERGMGGWGGVRQRVYDYEVKGLLPKDVGGIPYAKRENPPRDWNLPPEYMVAFLRSIRGISKTDAIKEVEDRYIPALKSEIVSESTTEQTMQSSDKQRELGESIARTLGIRYDGIQMGIGMQFTDSQTLDTFYGQSLEEVRSKLVKIRKKFADAENK